MQSGNPESQSKARCILWRRIIDDGSDEYCTVRLGASEAKIEGTLVGLSAELEPFSCSYQITCGSALSRSSFLSVRYRSANASRSLSMSRTKDGWTVGGSTPFVLDTDEIDLEWSPVTNLFPIRQMLERRVDSLALTTAWVRADSLRVERSNQRYERLDDFTVRYTNLDSGFSARIGHDGDGFPLNYEGVWEKRGFWRNGR